MVSRFFISVCVCMVWVSGITAQVSDLPSLPRLHAITVFPEDIPVYPADYAHWDYVNPQAAVGGVYTWPPLVRMTRLTILLPVVIPPAASVASMVKISFMILF